MSTRIHFSVRLVERSENMRLCNQSKVFMAYEDRSVNGSLHTLSKLLLDRAILC